MRARIIHLRMRNRARVPGIHLPRSASLIVFAVIMSLRLIELDCETAIRIGRCARMRGASPFFPLLPLSLESKLKVAPWQNYRAGNSLRARRKNAAWRGAASRIIRDERDPPFGG